MLKRYIVFLFYYFYVFIIIVYMVDCVAWTVQQYRISDEMILATYYSPSLHEGSISKVYYSC